MSIRIQRLVRVEDIRCLRSISIIGVLAAAVFQISLWGNSSSHENVSSIPLPNWSMHSSHIHFYSRANSVISFRHSLNHI